MSKERELLKRVIYWSSRDLDKSFLETTIYEIEKILNEPQIDVDWFCPNCNIKVDPRNVTYYERHDACGTYIGVIY
jgi:hypothetical protein